MGRKKDAKREYEDFTEFGLDARLVKAVLAMKFKTPTEVQQIAIPVALQRCDIMMKARTGSGKTLAFCLPLLQQVLINKSSLSPMERNNGPKALILAPTQELIFQIGNVINDLLKYADDAISGLALIQQGLIGMNNEKPRLQEGPDIVICTPARLAAHLDAGNVSLQYVQHVVVDEADLVMAQDYESDIKTIVKSLESVHKRPQMVMCSATLNPNTAKVQDWFLMHRPRLIDLGGHDTVDGADGSKLTEYVLQCGYPRNKFLVMYGLLRLEIVTGKLIIFCNSLDFGYRLKLFLERFMIRTAVLNPMLPVKSRQDIISKFNKGQIMHLITTDVIMHHDDRSNIMNYWVQPRQSIDNGLIPKKRFRKVKVESDIEDDDDDFDDDDDDDVLSRGIKDEVSSVGGHSGYDSTNPFDSGSMKAPSIGDADSVRNDNGSVLGDSAMMDTDHDTAGGMTTDGDVTESEWDFEDQEDDLLSTKNRKFGGNKQRKSKMVETQSGLKDIPREERDNLPLLESQGKIAYRGVDFRDVAAVINFIAPSRLSNYVHRAGRTARGGNYGVCITLCDMSEWNRFFKDRVYNKRVRTNEHGEVTEHVIQPLPLTMEDLQPFEYRCESVRKGITPKLVKLARLNELRMEILNAKRLHSQFADRERDVELKRHDTMLQPHELIKPHLASLPSYMLAGTVLGKNADMNRGKGKKTSGLKIYKQVFGKLPLYQQRRLQKRKLSMAMKRDPELKARILEGRKRRLQRKIANIKSPKKKARMIIDQTGLKYLRGATVAGSKNAERAHPGPQVFKPKVGSWKDPLKKKSVLMRKRKPSLRGLSKKQTKMIRKSIKSRKLAHRRK